MKKIIIIIALITIAIGQYTYAYNGYMGSKHMIKVEAGIWHPYAVAFPVSKMPLIHYGASYEYSYKRGKTIGISYSRIDFKDQSLKDRYGSKKVIYSNPAYKSLITNFNSNIIEISLKTFRTRANRFTPHGGYFGIGFLFMYSHYNSYELLEGSGSFPDYYSYRAIPISNKLFDGGFSFCIGRNYIFARRLVIGTEFKFTLPINAFIKTAGEGYSEEELFSRRALLYNILQFKLNFGTLF